MNMEPLSARRQRRSTRRATHRVLAVPALLFVASIAGLVFGLTGDGLPDIAAWLLLSLPIIATIRAWHRRR